MADREKATGGIVQGPYGIYEADGGCTFVVPNPAGVAAMLEQAVSWYGVKAVAANDREWCSIMDTAGVRPDGQPFDEAVLAAIRAKAVAQFTTALLAGLDDLERDDHHGTLVRPGDVADLVHRVAAEVGR